MNDSARETFIQGIDSRWVPIVVELDRAVTAAHAAFDTKIRYRGLAYALGGDFHRWVCAIDATSKAVHLRFLYGVLLDDPGGVFRGAETSPLRTIDYTSANDVDPKLVVDYVTEAVSKFDEFKARERALEERSRGAPSPGVDQTS